MLLLLFILLVVNVSGRPRGPIDCQTEDFESFEMDDIGSGPTSDGAAGIGAEFETLYVNFHNSACNLEDTFAAKHKPVEGWSGLDFNLSVDTGALELGAGKLNPEYVLHGRSIKVGDGSATAAGAAAANDFVSPFATGYMN